MTCGTCWEQFWIKQTKEYKESMKCNNKTCRYCMPSADGLHCDNVNIRTGTNVQNCKIRIEAEQKERLKMNSTLELMKNNIDEYIAIQQAYRIGRKIELRVRGSTGEWMCFDIQYDLSRNSGVEHLFNFNEYEYREKPEKKYRPWTFEEVPWGVRLVSKMNNPNMKVVRMIVSVEYDKTDTVVYLGGIEVSSPTTTKQILHDWLMPDGSPCGVEVKE
jgi:hypothetical protein